MPPFDAAEGQPNDSPNPNLPADEPIWSAADTTGTLLAMGDRPVRGQGLQPMVVLDRGQVLAGNLPDALPVSNQAVLSQQARQAYELAQLERTLLGGGGNLYQPQYPYIDSSAQQGRFSPVQIPGTQAYSIYDPVSRTNRILVPLENSVDPRLLAPGTPTYTVYDPIIQTNKVLVPLDSQLPNPNPQPFAGGGFAPQPFVQDGTGGNPSNGNGGRPGPYDNGGAGGDRTNGGNVNGDNSGRGNGTGGSSGGGCGGGGSRGGFGGGGLGGLFRLGAGIGLLSLLFRGGGGLGGGGGFGGLLGLSLISSLLGRGGGFGGGGFGGGGFGGGFGGGGFGNGFINPFSMFNLFRRR